MSRNHWLAVLVCANLVLATALFLFAAPPPPAALAQGTGLAGNYLIVTGEIQDAFDAIYLLDMRARALHAFYFRRGTNELKWAGYRNLELDFRHNQD